MPILGSKFWELGGLDQQESLANARVTRDNSACMKPLGKKSKLSRKPRPITKHHVDRQTGCEVMATFVSNLAVSRYLGFLKFESCTIRLADPENPTLEPSIMSLCCMLLARVIV